MSNRKGKNVRQLYSQQLLSGWSDFGQPENWNGNSSQKEQPKEEGGITAKQKQYQISIPVIIEKISYDGDKLHYSIRVYDDADIPLAPYSKRSKKALEPTITVPSKGDKGSVAVPMVYGIHESGIYSLSHTANGEAVRLSTQAYSVLLGAIDRAIEHTILKLEKQAGNDDTGKREKGSRTQESLGADKKARRRKTIRPEVLPEALPEESTGMDDTDRKILGGGQGDTKD